MTSSKKAWSIFFFALIISLIGVNLWIFSQVDHAIKEQGGIGKLVHEMIDNAYKE